MPPSPQPVYPPRRAGTREDDAIVIDEDDANTASRVVDENPSSPQHRSRGLTDRQHQQDSSAASSNSNSYAATLLHEKKVRSKLRESRHMAQCVLMDRELLMVHALASHETIPQTRRRFLAQLIAPDDPALVREILLADRPGPARGGSRVVSGSGSGSNSSPSSSMPLSREAIGALLPSTAAAAARGTVVDVVEDDDGDDCWRRRPATASAGVAVYSPKGKTPERRSSPRGVEQQYRKQRRSRSNVWSGGGGEREGASSSAAAAAAGDSDVDVEMDL